MEPLEPLFSFDIAGFTINIKPELVTQWIIILVIGLLIWWSTKDLRLRPTKKQTVVESIYVSLKNFVISNTSEDYADIIPFVGTLGIFLLFMNLLGLIGVVPPTKNFSVTVALGLITFYKVQAYAISKHGVKSYFKGYVSPMAGMLPLNILERVMLPVSLALRLFGNILAATFLVELVYEGLFGIFWPAQIGIPVPIHFYFDIFDGLIQTVIFVMLTMINIKIVSEH